jgi:hypothetical protein
LISPSLKEISLANGLILIVRDLSRIYYGDFHHVKLEICCEIPTILKFQQESVCSVNPDLPFHFVSYRRNLEKMGVPSDEVEQVKIKLLRDFEVNAIPYLLTPEFSCKLIDFELLRARKRANFPMKFVQEVIKCRS